MGTNLHQPLLDWYAVHKRNLPWRQTCDPYAVLVSETMLQQTGVERVIPKYHAFLERFPTLSALAEAPTADVIRLWSGLGYNRRAVWLQQAARQALAQWQGLPSSVAELMSLPGVGPYTARAVAAFAFGAEVAVVDTNVRRVLERAVCGLTTNGEGVTSGEIQTLADSLLPSGRAYEWNQALMELGATVCTHYHPLCMYCPLQQQCKAYPAVLATPMTAPSVAEERPRWQSEPFVGSRRYYRGRIIHVLRQLPRNGTIGLEELGLQIKPDFVTADLPWLRDLVEALAAEGLAQVTAEADGRVGVSLPR